MNTRHRITLLAVVVLSLAIAATLTATASNRAAQKSEQAAKAAAQARVKRGDYLVTAMGCHDCHTPWKMGANGPEPDMTRALSGHPENMKVANPAKLGNGPWVWAAAGTNTAFSGPWGISYTANLTPDRLTGIGIWNEEMFVKTIRTGRHWGVSRPILPPMPWQAFRHLSDEDLKSIYAYLRTVKPIKNQVPDAILAQQ
ncbi:MAG TPA: diheme cytochrome c-553 [Thermoanaerobaculia bacterium]|jgi:mono/diheme cytochrome c family protein|nr:diheme cytochrome c-553 [Thermoanaerobaculia bacterium]